MKLTYTTTDTTLPPLRYAHDTDACFDLPCAQTTTVSKQATLVSTGHRFKIPKGHCMLVFPRSSMAKRGFTMPNSVGVIDEGYRGIVQVVLSWPHGIESVNHGEYIAQAMVLPVKQAKLMRGDVPLETDRGEGGFGSTGR